MTPEDFGLTLEYPARPERGWKAIGDRRSLAVRARPSSASGRYVEYFQPAELPTERVERVAA
jgi:hypothetical protein